MKFNIHCDPKNLANVAAVISRFVTELPPDHKDCVYVVGNAWSYYVKRNKGGKSISVFEAKA